MKSSKFIAVHGIDGTGKTTLTQELAKGLHERGIMAATYDDYCEDFSVVNPHSARKAEAKRQDIDFQYDFFLLSAVYKSGVVKQAISAGYTVVADRWVADVHAHHLYVGAQPRRMLPDGLLEPDLSIILTVDESVRQARLLARGVATDDDLAPNVPGSRHDFFESFFMSGLRQRDLCLDTTHVAAPDAARYIIDRYFTDLTGVLPE